MRTAKARQRRLANAQNPSLARSICIKVGTPQNLYHSSTFSPAFRIFWNTKLYMDPESRFQENAQEQLGVTPTYRVLKNPTGSQQKFVLAFTSTRIRWRQVAERANKKRRFKRQRTHSTSNTGIKNHYYAGHGGCHEHYRDGHAAMAFLDYLSHPSLAGILDLGRGSSTRSSRSFPKFPQGFFVAITVITVLLIILDYLNGIWIPRHQLQPPTRLSVRAIEGCCPQELIAHGSFSSQRWADAYGNSRETESIFVFEPANTASYGFFTLTILPTLGITIAGSFIQRILFNLFVASRKLLYNQPAFVTRIPAMYLKRLEIFGFKSFAHHAVWNLLLGLTSYCWSEWKRKIQYLRCRTMGIGGTKSLKPFAGKAEDMIFSGSATKG